MAWSQGFTPHPRVSYAGAAPTGAASEAEYLELAVTRVCDPEQVRAALDAALPPGLDVVQVVEAGPSALADRLQASSWAIELPGAVPDQAAAAVTEFLAAASVPVERLTKNGVRQLDPRAAVLRLTADTAADPVTLRTVIRHQSPTVRPDEVLAGLRLVAGFTPPQPPRAVRLAQGEWDDDTGELADPLADAPERHDT